MLANKEFKVNDYLALRLEPVWSLQEQEEGEQETVIYVVGERFRQCKFLFLDISVNEISSFDEIDSIDEAASKLDRSQERNKSFKRKIPPEVEFWGHCSNLQTWAEYNYDTRLLHSNLAFPLLKKLTEAGDPIAKKVFREEIAKCLERGYQPVVEYLKEENYFKFLSHEELIRALTTAEEAEALLTIEKKVEKPVEILTELHEGKVGVFAIVKNRHIETLSLHKCNLEQIPIELKKLKKLETLYLTSNRISILRWRLEFTNLQYFYINNNQISLLPEWIGSLTSLKELDISYNPIEILPESITELKKIIHLNVERCPLKQYPDLSSDHLSSGLKALNCFLNCL